MIISGHACKIVMMMIGVYLFLKTTGWQKELE